MLMKRIKYVAQIVLHNEGKIFGRNRNKNLVALKNVGSDQTVTSIGCLNYRSFRFGVQKRLDQQRYLFVLKRFDRFRMDHRGPVVSELDRFSVGDLIEFFSFFEPLGVCVQHSGNIFPDRYIFRIQAIGKNSRGKIRSFSAQSGGQALRSMADKSLS